MLAGEDDRPLGLEQLKIGAGPPAACLARAAVPQGADAFGEWNLAPIDRYAVAQQARLARMERLDRLAADADLLGDRVGDELVRIAAVGPAGDIGADQHAALLAEAARRVHDVLVEPVGPGIAAVNAFVLPEARRIE